MDANRPYRPPRPSRPPRENDADSSGAQTGLEWREVVQGSHPGDQTVRIARHRSFRALGSGTIVPRRGVGEDLSFRGRLVRFIFGDPIPTAAEGTERVGVLRGLAVFASDNISSSAYATEEIMRVLILAGASALALTMPITLVLVGLIIIVVLSYREVIHAYPGGGGSYIVAHQNLGALAGLIAAAALLTDYILTVAVSVSAGVAALTSAFPQLYGERVAIAIVLIAFMTAVNLRGTREAGKLFAAPTYLYLAGMLVLIGIGVVQVIGPDTPEYQVPEAWHTAHGFEALTVLLVLRAFASGAVALTGTEAVSNGVPAFAPPEVRNAQIALVTMGTLFAAIFVGLSFLAGQVGIVPDPSEVETVVSQLARTLVGIGWFYYFLQFATALILILAANTAFNGFPRLASVLARDRYLPRQFSFRGDRLAFNSGIILLALLASSLIWVYQGSVTGLIPLYTVGVFIAFTLSQSGLVRRWWTHREQRGWRARLVTNGAGALVTGTVAVVVGVSKFMLGAWMVLVALPLLVWLMWGVNRHYVRLAGSTEPETPLDPADIKLRAIVPVENLALPARQAIAYAQAIADEREDSIVAVHITDDEAGAEEFRQEWAIAGYKIPLVIIESPFRSLIGPLLAYIEGVRETHPSDTITVILPEYVPQQWWEHLIHNQTALRIKGALLFHPGVVVASVPYHVQG